MVEKPTDTKLDQLSLASPSRKRHWPTGPVEVKRPWIAHPMSNQCDLKCQSTVRVAGHHQERVASIDDTVGLCPIFRHLFAAFLLPHTEPLLSSCSHAIGENLHRKSPPSSS